MPRYILIDRNSGYIWGDTADFASGQPILTPTEAAQVLDHTLKHYGCYEETDQTDSAATYDVYRADVDGSEAITVIVDGQDAETIAAVERDCKYVTSIRRTNA